MKNDSARAALWAALSRVNDPEVRLPITELGMVANAAIDSEGNAEVEVKLTITGCPAAQQIEKDVRAAVATVTGVQALSLQMSVMSEDERHSFIETVRAGKPARSNRFTADSLTRVIAVTSGKGGVGKSSVTASLALALTRLGLRVGIIDADIFGYSIPAILGLSADAKPTKFDDLILPPVAHGVKVVSIGMFLGDDSSQAIAWRGPMLHRTIEQFLSDVWFGDLDVLLLDLPPGTGDIALSVGQLLPHAEILVVTTPQRAAADVAVRSGLVAEKLGQRVIGVIENMAHLTLADGSRQELFGSGGGQAVADSLSKTLGRSVALLAQVPLTIEFRAAGDTGQPLISVPDDRGAGLEPVHDLAAAEILALAERIVASGKSLAGVKLPVSAKTAEPQTAEAT